MVIIKKASLVLGLFIYIAVGLTLKILPLFIKPALYLQIISRWTRLFNRFLRIVLGIRVIVEGNRLSLNENGNFIVSNHLGFLDGIVLGSLFRLIYTSKSEVRKWPLLGWMTMIGGTIFIDRKKKAKSPDYIQELSSALKQKLNVLVFAEGTSTKGEKLFPFQSVHFQSAINTGSPVLPIVISYTTINSEEANIGNRDKVCWYGQVSFYEHLCSALELGNIEAKVTIYPKIDSAAFLSRKELSEASYRTIAQNYPLFK